MAENTEINVGIDEKIADAVAIIRLLSECGAISIADEISGVSQLWQLLDASDKTFFLGMIKGSLVAMAGTKVKQCES